MTENRGFFRRPRTAKEVGDQNLSVKVSRMVKSGQLLRTGTVYYYRSGWFERLGEKWETKDVFLYNMLLFARQYEVISNSKQLETNPTGLRKVSAFMRKIADVLNNQADEIDRRAELLALEDSETEAAD